MPIFSFSFIVKAPLERVAAFHHDTRVLKRLTPPPIIIQLHKFEPLDEGSLADFTLWFGPLPIHWVAVHSRVDRLGGFTDTQRQGPLKFWQHTHSFTRLGGTLTQVDDHIEYDHHAGARGILSRLLFPKPSLFLLFTYRKAATRAMLEVTAE